MWDVEDEQHNGVVTNSTEVTPRRPTVDGERLIHVFKQLVEPIGRSLPSSSEVVLHDLSLLPNSIVAVHGDVTGRRVGDPATDLLLRSTVSDELDHVIGYETMLPDGRRLKSSTMIIRDVSDQPVAALCINSDITVWQSVSRIAESMIAKFDDAPRRPADPSALTPLGIQPPAESAADNSDASSTGSSPSEAFVHDVDELAALLIRQAIQETEVPVDLMRKSHKLGIVRSLKSRGMFLLRDAVEMIASALDVSRFTIYNYLNEIDDTTSDDDDVTSPAQ